MTYEWNAGDISNIITISSAALASVLMVLFRSRCIRISLCCGLWSCDRVVQEHTIFLCGILSSNALATVGGGVCRILLTILENY